METCFAYKNDEQCATVLSIIQLHMACGKMRICRPADLRMFTRVKCGLIMRIFRCGFTGKMRMRLRIVLCAVYSAEAGLLLRTEDCTPMLGHTNYTQVLGKLFLTCKLRNFFNEVLK